MTARLNKLRAELEVLRHDRSNWDAFLAKLAEVRKAEEDDMLDRLAVKLEWPRDEIDDFIALIVRRAREEDA